MEKTVKVCYVCGGGGGTNQEIYKRPNIKFLAVVEQYNSKISPKMLYLCAIMQKHYILGKRI